MYRCIIYIYIYIYIHNHCRINKLNLLIVATNSFMLLKQSSGNKPYINEIILRIPL